MRKQSVMIIAVLLTAGILIGLSSCKKDEKTPLTLSTLVAGTIDLNGAVAPSNVPSDPTITATFSTDVDAATAVAANIMLKRDYDNTNIALTITVAGKVITIVPNENLASGALHKLSFGVGLKSTDGEVLTAAVDRTFSTDGFFAPAGMLAHWSFDNSDATDQVGTFNAAASVAVTYVDGRKATAGKAASFNGTTSIIEIPNGDDLINPDFTLSFWVNAMDQGKGHFVIGLGAFFGFQFEIGGDFNSCKLAGGYSYEGGADTAIFTDNWWNGDGKTKDNDGWQGCIFNKDMTGSGGVSSLLKEKWAHIVVTYDKATKVGTIYINGEKMKAQDFNLWPAADKWVKCTGMLWGGKAPDVVNELAFGFIQSRAGTLWDGEPWGGYDFPDANHFKGLLDDVRIFDKAVTAAEVTLMYNSEKP